MKIDEIAKRMQGQDNRGTAHPIYIVKQRRRIYGMDTGYTDDFVYLWDGEEVHDPDKIKEWDEYWNEHLSFDDYPDPDLNRVGYIDTWEFVTCFFSEKSANNYIKANRHNLISPFVYVDSAYRNWEWQAVREYLTKLESK